MMFLALAPGAGNQRTGVQTSTNEYGGNGKKRESCLTKGREEYDQMPNQVKEPNSQGNTSWASSGSPLWKINLIWKMPSKRTMPLPWWIR